MDSQKPDASININLSTADIELGIANVLIALHQCGAIEMPQFLETLEQISSRTVWEGKDGQSNKSQFSQSVIRHLNKLSPILCNEDKQNQNP